MKGLVMASTEENNSHKKLVRSEDKMFLGVCGGIGNYFMIDPTIVRLVWIIGSALTGLFPGIIAYIIAAVVIPTEE
jgi:phage shock protein C